MAAAAALWPFFRELFFNRKAIFSFILRHRLGIVLGTTCTVLFLLLMFMTEQSIRQELRYGDDIKVIQDLKRANDLLAGTKKALDQCTVDRDVAQDNYRTLSHSIPTASSGTVGPAKPNPNKHPRGNTSEPALAPRDYDSYARKRLKAIDGE